MICSRCGFKMSQDAENDFTCWCGNVVCQMVISEFAGHETHRYPIHPRKKVVWTEERKQAARDRLLVYSAIYNAQRKQEGK